MKTPSQLSQWQVVQNLQEEARLPTHEEKCPGFLCNEYTMRTAHYRLKLYLSTRSADTNYYQQQTVIASGVVVVLNLLMWKCKHGEWAKLELERTDVYAFAENETVFVVRKT